MDNISFLLLNSAGGAWDFTFQADGRNLPNSITVNDRASTTIRFRVNGAWLTGLNTIGVTSSEGGGLIRVWSFAIDNIEFTQSAPEPASFLLIGSGLIILARLRRRMG